MPRAVAWLGVLLAVQIVTAVGFNLSTLWPSVQPGAAPLVEVAQNQINRIVLEGPEQAKVVLAKEGDTWTLPALGKFPADANRVNAMLGKIAQTKTGASVATTAGAKTRFRVDDETFERRITLAENDKTLATLYVGSSPGLRRSYVRAGGNDAIFVLELAAYDIPVQLADWEDKTVLRLPKNDITALEVAGLRIEQVAQPASSPSSMQTDSQTHSDVSALAWKLTGIEAGRPPELRADAVDKLTRVFADLSFDKVLGRDLRKEYGIDKPLLSITVTRKIGDRITYLLGKDPQNDLYTLKTSNRPEFFRLPSYRATALLEAADRKQLLTAPSGAHASTKG